MEERQSTAVKGLVDNITYQNADNGYTVCTIDCDGQPVTLVGTIPTLTEGEYINAQGYWTTHATYGKQFCVTSYQKELPATTDSILAYLSSGVIKGVGPVTARRIVEKYGSDTLKVLEEHPDWLTEIKGITSKRVKDISESFKSQYGMRQVMLYFQGMLSPALCLRVYKQWGNAAVDVLKNNPYILCDRIDGIGFEKADALAQRLGFGLDNQDRIYAGVKYTLSYDLNHSGNCCMPLNELKSKAAALLAASENAIEEACAMLSQNGEVIAIKRRGGDIVIYLEEVYATEKFCAEKLLLLDEAVINIPIDNPDSEIEKVEQQTGIFFAPLQKVAIKSSVARGVVIVTGGPGTGKTTVIRAIISLFKKIGSPFCLAAPTGRAAKRMTAATGFRAKTIHRLLECDYTSGEDRLKFKRDEDNHLDEEVIIIDEASMVDVFLFCALLRAIRPGSRLIIIGDADQLSPVGAGEVFSDMIKANVFMSVQLSDIFRQAQGSSIVTNAHLIKEGRMPECDNRGDFFFMKRTTADSLRELVLSLCTDRLPKAYGYDALKDIQIVCPTRKGDAGTVSLNVMLQKALNPPSTSKSERQVRDVVFREGDKVMVVHNNYDIEWTDEDGTTGNGVFNGDIGFIVSIDRSQETFTINFDDGRIAEFDFSGFDDLEHAYAITVHKSQGSEYTAVIIPLYGCPHGLVSRNMLYTALTRAGKLAIITGKADILCDMVRNERRVIRNTGLCEMLEKLKKKREQEQGDTPLATPY